MSGKNPRKILGKLKPMRVQAFLDSQGKHGTVRKVSATEAEAILRREIDLGGKIADFPISVYVHCEGRNYSISKNEDGLFWLVDL